MITRFAPSPTGLLHVGHAYSARYAYQLAGAHNGTFLLRFEDIDKTRVQEDYYTEIKKDLRWLGLHWNQKPIRQSERMELYVEALEKLKAMGVIYPCFCTRQEILAEVKRSGTAPHNYQTTRYPRTCKKKSHRESKRLILSGKAYSLRLDTKRASQLIGDIFFHDKTRGLVAVDPELLGDLVLARKDISTSYHLAVVVDDALQNITHVSRGEDLLRSTHVHRVLQELLGLATPNYDHHMLVCDAQGRRLAKRDKALCVRSLRQDGMKAGELFSYLLEKENKVEFIPKNTRSKN